MKGKEEVGHRGWRRAGVELEQNRDQVEKKNLTTIVIITKAFNTIQANDFQYALLVFKPSVFNPP